MDCKFDFEKSSILPARDVYTSIYIPFQLFFLISRCHFLAKLHIHNKILHYILHSFEVMNSIYHYQITFQDLCVRKSPSFFWPCLSLLQRSRSLESVSLLSFNLLSICYRGQGLLSRSLPASVEAWTIVSYSHHQMA